MTIEAEVQALTVATTDLLEAVNIGKANLDAAENAAELAAAQALESQNAAEAAQLDIQTNWGDKLASADAAADIAVSNAALTDADRIAAAQSAADAGADRIAAEAARDAALIQAGVYATEALGRAAVADGVAFKVQGSGDVAAYEYRRTDASTSVLIATYPSASIITQITAEAVQIVANYNSALTFIGFVNAATATPAHTENNAYISTVDGTCLGVSVSVGQIILDDGVNFKAAFTNNKTIYPLADKSYNKLDPNLVIAKYYLDSTTGKPVYSNIATRFITEFIAVTGVTFVNSQIYGSGSLLAYDKYKVAIADVPFNGGGVNGKYILPENTAYIRLSGFNASDNWLYLDELVQSFYAYGITKEGLGLAATNTEILKRSRLDYVNTLNLKDGVNTLDRSRFITGYKLSSFGDLLSNADYSASPYIYCKGKTFLNTNMYFYGGIYFYTEDYICIATGAIADGKFTVPSNAYYVRGEWQTAAIEPYLYFNIVLNKYYPYNIDRATYKLDGKKLVTIGDSITYQKSWQPRLIELTGMEWDADETRLGVGYVEIDGTTHADIGNYVRVNASIVSAGTTFVNSYGATVSIYSDGTKFYRKALRMAEGGETVMPVATQSIYSRCADSKYYEPDVIIVHAGANDRGFTNWLPTTLPNQKISDITGLANLETDNPDNVADYEIYTTAAVLSDIGDYIAQGDLQGTQKYSATFRACYRGMMKKIVDANPAAIIVCIQPHQTILYSDATPNKVAVYVTSEVNRVIADVAAEFGCQVINLQKLFGTYNAAQWFSSDGLWIHPNAAGGNKMADYIASQL